MINLHERMLPTSAGVEPATSWSPVGRRIQLSHRGRQLSIILTSLIFHCELARINFCPPRSSIGKWVFLRKELSGNAVDENSVTVGIGVGYQEDPRWTKKSTQPVRGGGGVLKNHLSCTVCIQYTCKYIGILTYSIHNTNTLLLSHPGLGTQGRHFFLFFCSFFLNYFFFFSFLFLSFLVKYINKSMNV